MAFVLPYRQNNYLGSFANEADALAFVQAQLWDSTKNGAGTPEVGMEFDDTTDLVRKTYRSGAWEWDATQAWTTAQITAAVIAGRNWRELLLVNEQVLDGAAGGVRPAILCSFTGLPTIGDTVTIRNGAVTEVYLVQAAHVNPFDVVQGADFDAFMVNLVTEINLDSAVWSAVSTTHLDRYFAGLPTNQVVIYNDLAVATAAETSRMYATLSGAGAAQVVEFATAGEGDYDDSASVEAAIAAADPAARRFGFGRAVAALRNAEKHGIVESEYSYSWDDDSQTWDRVMVPNTPRFFTLAGNPNAGAGTAGTAGDECLDTVGVIGYKNSDGTATGWVVAY